MKSRFVAVAIAAAGALVSAPAGVGSARTPPIYLKAGDKTSCSYEGVGTLNNDVR